MRIGIDIDDTITDIKEKLDNAAIDYAKKLGKYKDNYNKNFYDPENNGNGYQKTFDFNYDELRYFLKDIQESITDNALPRKNAVEIINKLKNEGHSIIIITARDSEFHDNPYHQSKEWLDKNNIHYDKIIVNARDKGIACLNENIDIYIDDKESNCIRVQNLGIETIRISNENSLNNLIKNFNNWIDIYNYINNHKIVKIIDYNKKYKEEINTFVNKSMHEFIGRDYKERPDLLDIENYYLNNEGIFLCAIDVLTGTLIGTIALENRGNIGILKRFYVKKEYQKLGIGIKLYNRLENYIKEKNKIEKIYLACANTLTKAHEFYQKRGFKQIEVLDIEMHTASDDDIFLKEIR